MPKPGDILVAAGGGAKPVPILALRKSDWPKIRAGLAPAERTWVDACGFRGDAGKSVVVPDPKGEVSQVLVGIADAAGSDPFDLGKLSRTLPQGLYSLKPSGSDARLAALGWCLEAYAFDRYGKSSPEPARLVCPAGVDRQEVVRTTEAVYLTRDLVNIPALDMGPDELEAAARHLARSHRAVFKTVRGPALERGFPMIHAVGMASERPPRLVDLRWGPKNAPKVTLVGKGVCFDTGGLDIKPPSGMALMKKDMGGAANVLGLAQMIMAARLPVRLRVLIPAVENAIAGNAFRPGDILRSRKGLTVEIGNTDAEGRLVLADALALADEEEPDLLIDMATLTGAARAALGPDLPAFYASDDKAAEVVARAALAENDPVWRMPFWQPYHRLYESHVADFNNSGDSGFAGSITAALFLKRFVEKAGTYLHFDIYAWTPHPRPGRPRGGEAQGIRALYAMIRKRYAK